MIMAAVMLMIMLCLIHGFLVSTSSFRSVGLSLSFYPASCENGRKLETSRIADRGVCIVSGLQCVHCKPMTDCEIRNAEELVGPLVNLTSMANVVQIDAISVHIEFVKDAVGKSKK